MAEWARRSFPPTQLGAAAAWWMRRADVLSTAASATILAAVDIRGRVVPKGGPAFNFYNNNLVL